ncbi:hypothetical protein AVEN_181833-1 [Araneus ventricosus]|uniref:Uncharacterized protein n=1 Tax=Araneus ventricosus TaxID=182803 RepID=A0A4Y2EZC7_ARAVE|nr:hypothetical protein AVEN_181833-1 [Araneus ventricosus]
MTKKGFVQELECYHMWNHPIVTDTARYVLCLFALEIAFDAQYIPRLNATHSLGGGVHIAKFCLLRQLSSDHCLYKHRSLNITKAKTHKGLDRVTEEAKMLKMTC